MKTNMKKQLIQSVLGTLLITASMAGYSQEAKSLKGDNQIGEDYIASLIDGALPEWDRSIFDVKPEKNPIDALSFNQITDVMDDRPFEKKPPKNTTQISDADRFVKLDSKQGKVRYVNRPRSWNFKLDAKTSAIAETQAHDIALATFEKLGFSPKNMKNLQVKTQMAGGAKAGAKEIQDIYEMYRLVLVQRQINGLPVYGNNLKMALNYKGQIQRLGINWSAFNINRDTKLRSRKEVIKQAVEEIMSQDPDSSMKINAKLAYAKTKLGNFKPVTVISVNSLPTPYQILVPLGDLADTHDKD